MKPRISLMTALTVAAVLVAARLAYPPPPVPNRPGFTVPYSEPPAVAIRGVSLPEQYQIPKIVIPREEYFLLASDTYRPESGKWNCDSRGFIKGVPGVCDLLDRQRPRELRMTLQEVEIVKLKFEPAPPK
jgi:hypothetical protein